ncbi:MAG: thioredoxin-related protein [Flavobacteriales bacterium]|jgi:thioredoxin-related protein
MFRFIAVFVAFLPLLVSAQGGLINWMTVEEAQAAQKKVPKKIMMDVYTHWCGPCKMLDAQTFQNADVANYVNDNYYAVKFNAEHPAAINFKGKDYTNPTFDPTKSGRNGVHELSRALGVSAYPTIIFLDEELNTISPVTGYKTAQQLELYLKFFHSNEYKTVTTKEQWQEYQKGFKPVFK